jgi:hypothetical protein
VLCVPRLEGVIIYYGTGPASEWWRYAEYVRRQQ